MTKRIPIDDYKGNLQFGGLTQYMYSYCFGCKQHRTRVGGKTTGKLRLFKCAECLANKEETKKTQPSPKEQP